jgi:hypothetical protein
MAGADCRTGNPGSASNAFHLYTTFIGNIELFVIPSLQIIDQRETPFWFCSGTQKAAIYDLIVEVTSLQRLTNPVPVIYVSITFIGTLDISITNTSGPKTLRICGMQEWSKFN